MAELDKILTEVAARRRGAAIRRARGAARWAGGEDEDAAMPGLDLENDVPLRRTARRAAEDEAKQSQTEEKRARRRGGWGAAFESAAAGLTANVGEIPATREGAVLGGLMKGIAGVGLTQAARRRAEAAAAADRAKREETLEGKKELARFRAELQEDPAEKARRTFEATLPARERLARIQSGESVRRAREIRSQEAGLNEDQKRRAWESARDDAARTVPNYRWMTQAEKDEATEDLYLSAIRQKPSPPRKPKLDLSNIP